MVCVVLRTAILAGAAACLGACATTAPTRLPPVTSHYSAADAAPAAEAPAPPSVPSAAVPNPVYKVGQPYQVGGVWYYPQEQPDYDETGIASWYGIDYQGKPTADGELFDRNAISGAHPTLPMPVNVRVTNLENGRSLVVRINDRGPYVNGRILDLSEHAAELLGYRQMGLARVRVSFLGRADLYGPGLAPPSQETPVEIATAVPAAPVVTVQAAALPPLAGTRIAPATMRVSLPQPIEQTFLPPLPQVADGRVLEMPVPPATAIYVQAGAYTSPANAGSVASKLQSAGARVVRGTLGGRPIYRVRIGPFQSVEDADAALLDVLALGHNDVQIVVDSVAG